MRTARGGSRLEEPPAARRARRRQPLGLPRDSTCLAGRGRGRGRLCTFARLRGRGRPFPRVLRPVGLAGAPGSAAGVDAEGVAATILPAREAGRPAQTLGCSRCSFREAPAHGLSCQPSVFVSSISHSSSKYLWRPFCGSGAVLKAGTTKEGAALWVAARAAGGETCLLQP